jgi:hypothetical protein
MTKDEALDLALEALEESQTDNDTMEFWDRKTKAITAIKQARSAPVQSCYCPNCEAMGKELAALKAQRQWVGMTDDEIFSVLGNLQRKYNGPPTDDSRVVFALAIEAKLKEKNT